MRLNPTKRMSACVLEMCQSCLKRPGPRANVSFPVACGSDQACQSLRVPLCIGEEANQIRPKLVAC